MNFTGTIEGRDMQVELKYCERCGGLWLRPQGTGGVYCSSCQLRLDARPTFEAAPARKGRRRPRPGGFNSDRATLRDAVRIECLQGVAVMGVRL